MEHLRGHRLTNAESELLAVQDLYTIDDDLLNETEASVPCGFCGKLVTVIDKMPAGWMRNGNLYGICSECARKMMLKAEERNSILAP